MKTYTYSYQNGLCRGREAGRVPEGTRMHVPGRAVGPVDHSPGRNPGAQRHTPPTNRAARPEWDVPGPPVFDRIGYPAPPPRGFAPIVHTPGVSPLAMIRRPYRALPCTRPGCRPGGP